MLTSYTVFQKICDLRTQGKISIRRVKSLTKALSLASKHELDGELERLLNRLEKIK